jgi:hypothetical protein
MDIDALERVLELNGTQWHDGNLRQVTYVTSADSTYVLVSVEIYETNQSPVRHAVTFKFLGVRDYMQAGTSAELQQHYGPGHIIQARPNANPAGLLDLSIYLTGGYMRIVSESVTVVEVGN